MAAAAAPATPAVPPVIPSLAASTPAPATGPAADWPAQLGPCRLDGLATALRCASLRRPLDPARPDGVQIALHYAVLPALSRHKADDPVVFLAGGPGQSATELAGPLAAAYQRLGQRRDLVFIDQRGTGRSAPLRCPDDAADAPQRSLAEQADDTARLARLQACRRALQALPHGDLRFYSTAIASADLDAVRAALGVARVNLIAASYGTRAALDYQRQFPTRVRRAVLDGVVPPDMRLADSAAQDNQATLDGVINACAAEPACARRHPALRAQWQALLAGLPRAVSLPHPGSGLPETVTL
ncbi:MAG: cysteine protease, partial [Burkholderiales bacterium PBB5]